MAGGAEAARGDPMRVAGASGRRTSREDVVRVSRLPLALPGLGSGAPASRSISQIAAPSRRLTKFQPPHPASPSHASTQACGAGAGKAE